MKKNKGFTLIELLAVLVIIAIIALIITPIVTGVIKDSRIKASENAMNGLAKAVDVYYGKRMMANDGKFNDYAEVIIVFEGSTSANFTLPAGTGASGNGYINTAGLEKTYNYVADPTGMSGAVIDGKNKNILEYKGADITGGMIVVDRNGVQKVVKPIRINNYFCTNLYGTNKSVKCTESAAELE